MDFDYIFNLISYIHSSYFSVQKSIKYNPNLLICIFSGIISTIGGGTIRDIIIKRPLFWIETPSYIYITILTSTITILLHHWKFKLPTL